MIFQYRVKSKEGKTITGTLEGQSVQDAINTLRGRDFLVLDVHEQEEVTETQQNVINIFQRVGFGEIVEFTRQLSTMIIAGLPLIDSLNLLETQTGNRTFRKILADIIQQIRGGTSLATALTTYPRQFSKIYAALISAGEKSGKFDVVIDRLATNLEKERSFRSKIQTAMIYPIIIVIGIIALTFLMMIFVIPQLTEIYTQFDIELPLPTRILIGMSNFFTNFWWLILIVLGGLAVWLPSLARTEGGSRLIDSFTLRIPIIGTLKKDIIMTEMTRTLGLLVGAGVPILKALEIVAEALGSPSYKDHMTTITAKVEKGFPLGLMFSQDPIFPPIVGQMLIIGEETGRIDETMDRISKYFESQADEKVKRLSTAIEPIILVFLGIGVAFVVLSIVLPMYQLTEAF